MTETSYMKPLPEPSPDTAPFWKFLQEGKLKLQACAACGKLRHYPRPVCPDCYSMDATWVESKGRGTIHTWTIAHHPFHPGFKSELPYVLVTVDLEDGVRMQAQLRGCDVVEGGTVRMRGLGAEQIKIGMQVKVAFEIATKDLTLPVFVTA